MHRLTWATLPAELIYQIVDYSIDNHPCCERIGSLMSLSRHWFDTLRGVHYDTYAHFRLFNYRPDEINRLKRYLSSPYARERPVHEIKLEFESDASYKTIRDQLSVIMTKNRFRRIHFCIYYNEGVESDDDDDDDDDEEKVVRKVPIRLPKSLKAYELTISGAHKSILDWSSFNPFLKRHLRKLELHDLGYRKLWSSITLDNLESLTIHNNSDLDDYSFIVQNCRQIKYLDMQIDDTIREFDDSCLLELCSLKKLETLITNIQLDYDELHCPFLKHIKLTDCIYPISEWSFDKKRIETLRLDACRLMAFPSLSLLEDSDFPANVENIKEYSNLKVLRLCLSESAGGRADAMECKNIEKVKELFNRGEFDDCWPHLEEMHICNSLANEMAVERFIDEHKKLSISSRESLEDREHFCFSESWRENNDWFS